MSSAAKLTLAEKIARVMGAVSRVPKNGWNDFHRYKYATEGDVADTVREALAKEGLAIIPSTEDLTWREIQGKNGMEKIATVKVRYTITDGPEKYEAVFLGEGQDRGDKAVYKAYTGAHKYFLLRTFNISTGDDQDPEREDDAPPRQQPKVDQERQAEEASADRERRFKEAVDAWRVKFSEAKGQKGVSAVNAEFAKGNYGQSFRDAVRPYYEAAMERVKGKPSGVVTQELLDEAAKVNERQPGEDG